jgi:L-ascorbate metabolism protein UlaG (beta-lactamase superfamily)
MKKKASYDFLCDWIRVFAAFGESYHNFVRSWSADETTRNVTCDGEDEEYRRGMGIRLVDVIWLGHACFLLRSDTKSLIFDPFKGTGLPEPKLKADIVLCSHSHSDHNNVAAVKHEKSAVLEKFTGTKQIDGVSVKGIATFHDDAEGGKRGRNSVYVVELEGVRFCHLGDLGHELTPSEQNEIGSVDVLFIPIGGFFTIGPQQARNVMKSLKPKITVPMHYNAPGMSITFKVLKKVEDFLSKDDMVKKLDGSSFTINKTDLPEKEIVIVPKLIH